MPTYLAPTPQQIIPAQIEQKEQVELMQREIEKDLEKLKELEVKTRGIKAKRRNC